MAKTQTTQPGLDNIPGAGEIDSSAGQQDKQPSKQAQQGTEETPQQDASSTTEPAGKDPTPSDPPPELQAPTLVECAVLMDCIYGKHDDIIELPIAEARAAEKTGAVDTHPNAVAAIRAGI